jgi:hypothetical protein
MVTGISEADARTVLRSVRSEASNPGTFEARRRDHGWMFVWRREGGRPPVGTRSWVVADNGRARAVDLGSRADETIALLLGEPNG